jgi:hypothetical protein
MKTKIEMTNGDTTIILTPENDFEKSIINGLNVSDLSTNTTVSRSLILGEEVGNKNFYLSFNIKHKNV